MQMRDTFGSREGWKHSWVGEGVCGHSLSVMWCGKPLGDCCVGEGLERCLPSPLGFVAHIINAAIPKQITAPYASSQR